MGERAKTKAVTEIKDLRDWLAAAEALGELQVVNGADWNLEIGGISEMNYRCRPFDWIDEFPQVAEASPDLRSRITEKWGHLFKK